MQRCRLVIIEVVVVGIIGGIVEIIVGEVIIGIIAIVGWRRCGNC